MWLPTDFAWVLAEVARVNAGVTRTNALACAWASRSIELTAQG